MLEELLKHDKLGNKDEILFFLFDGLSIIDQQSIINIRKYCTSNLFSISQAFDGILMFLQFISFIRINDDKIILNKDVFNNFSYSKKNYFDHFHLYENLLKALENRGVKNNIFNENNIKYNSKIGCYYVLENKFPYKYFSIRNLLLSTGFFYRNSEFYPNHLLIKKEFTDQFKIAVIDKLSPKKDEFKKINLAQLKEMLKNKEEAGKLAELFALEYEYKRLEGHPNIDKIAIISKDYTNAGYDIESFNDIDSIVIDKLIEVKSYKDEISFYWSKNEVNKAKNERGRYYIYLVDRSRINEASYKPQQFQDPYKKIFENDIWKKETENWKITLED